MSYSRYLSALLLSLTINLTIFADDFLWLEDIEGTKALNWVKEQNQATDHRLMQDPLYEALYADAMAALSRDDKLPDIKVKGAWVYNLWKDKANPRGLYRRSSIDSFTKGAPEWQTVLDIDKLSAAENMAWVFHDLTCLKPDYERCLMSLSPGGSDAHVIREFNPNLGAFVEAGFEVPLAKTSAIWLDEDHLLIGTDFGKDSLTDSGYPRLQKIWRRGTDLSAAKTILEVPKRSVSASAAHYTGDDYAISVLIDATNFWNRQHYLWQNNELQTLELPDSARIEGALKGKLVVSLKNDWSYLGKNYLQGSVLMVDPLTLNQSKAAVSLVAEQTTDFIVNDVEVTDEAIVVEALEDVKSALYFFRSSKTGWQQVRVELPQQGAMKILAEGNGTVFVRYEDFLTPPTLYAVDTENKVSQVMQQAPTFDSSNMKVEQFFARSADGTRVPYFVIMNKDTQFNSKNPTHIFSYGGFRNALVPSYSGSYEDLNGAYGNMWLRRGGVYVLANIRGGGEYGPAWHAAALKENRNKSFEDFEAVAEDLIARKITSSAHLGMEGRSNGGLLVGAVMTRRPELFGAVVCGVPLLDMSRYHKLLAGASWMAEFGDPDSDDWNYIKTYSPYQNVHKDTQYPATFFFTSTKDDRVHPGHARKMAAKLKALGQDVEYYENTEGGHKGSATKEQLAKRIALAFTHLWRELR